MMGVMWVQLPNPFDSIGLSALVAAVPIVALCVMLLSRKVAGWIASLITLVLALVVAMTAFNMPAELAVLSTAYGALQGLFPIGWIVLNAVLLYNISVRTGSFAIVRDTIESITVDRRLQALLIAFCFGAFLEGSAGFGAPVAITAGMLVGLGFEALYAAGICLIANTAPVAFGGIGIAVITAGTVTGIDPNLISRMVGHQLPFIAAIIPLWLTVLISGWKGAKEIWPALVVAGGSYAFTMYVVASFVGPMLPDILSAVVSISAMVLLLKFWQPKSVWPDKRGHHIHGEGVGSARDNQGWPDFLSSFPARNEHRQPERDDGGDEGQLMSDHAADEVWIYTRHGSCSDNGDAYAAERHRRCIGYQANPGCVECFKTEAHQHTRRYSHRRAEPGRTFQKCPETEGDQQRL
jgi:lactate permease